MNPNNGSQSGGAPNPQGPNDQQSAAANLIRSQIDSLYGDRPVAYRDSTQPAIPQRRTYLQHHQASQSQTQPDQRAPQQVYEQNDNPYDRTHTPHPQPQADQWKAYHSAWQNYYQKYYEAYYTHQHSIQQAPQAQNPANSNTATQANEQVKASTDNQSYFSQRTDLEQTTEDLSRDQALFELRQKLLGKVRHQAKKIRKSRHFVPIAAALAVVLIFVFLQYNRVFIATVNAYVSPGSIDPQNIVIDPSGGEAVSQDPRLIIPKINVDVPVIYGIGPDHSSQMAAMEKGVAHFSIPGANSKPGELGNTVLSGHSSNDLFDGGDYKFIFAQLDKLQIGDTIYANYEGVRYSYVVTKKEVVKPTQVNKLVYPTDKPVMTLITCTPLGTSIDRLLVTAEQISPDPTTASAAPSGSGQGSEGASIPGNSPTMLERLFGSR